MIETMRHTIKSREECSDFARAYPLHGPRPGPQAPVSHFLSMSHPPAPSTLISHFLSMFRLLVILSRCYHSLSIACPPIVHHVGPPTLKRRPIKEFPAPQPSRELCPHGMISSS